MKLISWKISIDMWTTAWPNWPSEATVLAERFDQVVFCDHKDAPTPDWARGHLFTPDLHVAWRQLGAHVRVVIAAKDVPQQAAGWGAPANSRLLDACQKNTQQLALWGNKNKTDPYWIELYIPHIMESPEVHLHPAGMEEAPKDKVSRRLLEVETYTEPKSGALVYHRYSGLRHAVYKKDDLPFGDLNISPDYKIPEFKLDWWSDAS